MDRCSTLRLAISFGIPSPILPFPSLSPRPQGALDVFRACLWWFPVASPPLPFPRFPRLGSVLLPPFLDRLHPPSFPFVGSLLSPFPAEDPGGQGGFHQAHPCSEPGRKTEQMPKRTRQGARCEVWKEPRVLDGDRHRREDDFRRCGRHDLHVSGPSDIDPSVSSSSHEPVFRTPTPSILPSIEPRRDGHPPQNGAPPPRPGSVLPLRRPSFAPPPSLPSLPRIPHDLCARARRPVPFPAEEPHLVPPREEWLR
eukprot:scaffold1518_cov331-Pavlova_lutheri.AAC.8